MFYHIQPNVDYIINDNVPQCIGTLFYLEKKDNGALVEV